MKRTIALILALVMVLPVSFISALAHGPGVGKNNITNQSIHNALNQPLPEVVTVDGKYDDTAWDKDEWNTVNKRTGTWDSNAPDNVNFSYKYQIKMDGDYLYGVFALASGASEITVWLNDSNASAATDTIVISNLSSAKPEITVNGSVPSFANGTDSKYPAEQYQIKAADDTVEAGMRVVEFRVYRKAFASGESVSYFVAAKNGNHKLYYPVIATNGETAPATPEKAWPANAIVVTRRDLLDVTSDKHLPINDSNYINQNVESQYEINIDGRLTESTWIYLSDLQEQDKTGHQYFEPGSGKNGDIKESLIDLTLGSSNSGTGVSTVHGTPEKTHTHTHGGIDYLCGSDYNLYTNQGIKFKYDIRTDGTFLYGAVVVYDRRGVVKHNAPDSYDLSSSYYKNYDNGTYGSYEATYSDTTYLNLHLYSGDTLWRTFEIKNSDDHGSAVSSLNMGSWSDATSLPVGVANDNKTQIGCKRISDQLVTYEFKIHCKDIFGSATPGNGTLLTDTIGVELEAFEGEAIRTTEDGGYARTYDAYAKCNKFVLNRSTHPAQSQYLSGLYMNGTIDDSEWNNLNAADDFVDGANKISYNSGGSAYGIKTIYGAGDVKSYLYDVVADHDYIYGATLILLENEVKHSDVASEATTFRLWLNDGGTNSTFSKIVSFHMGTNEDTRVMFSGVNGTYVKNSEGYFVNDSTQEKEYGLQANMRIVNINEMVGGYESLYPGMAAAIKAGKVAVLEYRIPFTMTGGCEMPLYDGNGSTNGECSFSYFTSVEDGYNTGLGLVHPMPDNQIYYKSIKRPDGTYHNLYTGKVFAHDIASTWTKAPRSIYAVNALDTIKIDGMRTEFFWNSYEDYIGVNGSTGYYDKIQESNNTFAYGQTIYVGRNNLYGYVILDDEAVPGESEYVLWINTDPASSDSYTHAFYFTINDDGVYVSGKKSDDTAITSSDYIVAKAVGSTINGRTSIEFIIDIRSFDADRSGFEYATSFRHVINEEVLNLCYPATDAYDKLFVTHINQTSSLDYCEGNIFSYEHLQKDNGATYKHPNGYAASYYVFNPTGNTNEYRVDAVAKAPGNNTDNVDDIDDLIISKVEPNGFVYGIYDTSKDGTPTAFGNGYIADCDAQFTVGATVKFKGADFDLSKKVDGAAKNDTYGYELDALDISFSVKKTDAIDRNANFPEKGVWYSTALTVDTLGYFYPEIINIDGNIEDSGWDKNGWTEVAENTNGVLQSVDYEKNLATSFNYKYQMRTDGENVYFAFVVHDRNFADLIEQKNNKDQTVTSVPSVRVWIKSNAAKYSDAVSFTHLYDIRYGMDASIQGNYKDGNVYSETTLDITAADLTIHGQDHASFETWYGLQGQGLFLAGQYNRADRGNAQRYIAATLNGTKITYTNTHLRFAEHTGTSTDGGYAYPWGGNASRTGTTCTDQGYGDSLIYGETLEIMENRTTGAHGSDETWYAYTDTSGFEVGNEHGRWSYDEATDDSYVEFKFNLSELGFTKEELEDPSFEYFVHGASSGDNYSSPYTLFNPAMTHIPYSAKRSCTIYSLPFWNFDEVTSLKYNASTEYSHMLRNNYRPSVSLGAKVTDDFDGKGTNAIRFGGLYTEEYIRRLLWGATNKGDEDYYRDGEKIPYDYADQNGIQGDDAINHPDRVLGGANMDGITNYWDVAKVGIVFQFTQKLTRNDNGEVDLTLDTPGVGSADSVGIYQWTENSNFADYEKYVFYVTLNGLPDQLKGLKLSFRSFVTYYDWQDKYDGSPAVYDEILERSWNQVNENGGFPAYDEDFKEDDDEEDENTGSEEEDNNFNGETIAYIPLDNRPVNIDRAIYLAQASGFNIIMPPEEFYTTKIDSLDVSGDESAVGNPEQLFAWLKDVERGDYGDVNYYVISLDQLLSGGLVGSRDFAGINNLPNAANDGAYYDPNLGFEETVIDYLADLVKEKEVVFFDSQMRLASTSNFNGYEGDDYNFFRYGYAMLERPYVNVEADNALDLIFANYGKDKNGNDIVNSSNTNGNNVTLPDYRANTNDPDYKSWAVGLTYTVEQSFIDRYLDSRERKMKISKMLFDKGVVANSKLFYVGIDDSNPRDTIHKSETEWLRYKGTGLDNFKVFSGIDEIGLMSLSAFVTSCYGKVNSIISYYGDGQNEAADNYGTETLDQSIRVHLQGVGANIVGSTATKNYLSVLVLTKGADASDISGLLEKARTNISEGIPTCIIDASDKQGQLGVELVNSNLELAKLLGYSNWNTVANAAGLSISPAVARYTYLKNSDVITEASHAGFLKQISYSFIKDVAYTYKFKTQWEDSAGKNTYKDGGDYEANRIACAKDAVSNDSFYTWKDKIVDRINGKTGSTESNAMIMTSVGNYEVFGQIRVISDIYWPWNRMFEASFDLGVKGATNVALSEGTTCKQPYSSSNDTYCGDLNDNEVGPEFDWNADIYPYWYSINKDNIGEPVTFEFAEPTAVNMVQTYTSSFSGGGIATPQSIEVLAKNETTGEYESLGFIPVNSSTGYSTLWLENTIMTSEIQIKFTLKPSSSHIMVSEIKIW